MSLLIDLHVHTKRYSPCSAVPPERLVSQAVKAGLDGLVITEHHRQWSDDELALLVEQSTAPGFVLLSGMEYTSGQGDLLIFGLEAGQANGFEPWLSPEEAVRRAIDLGGVCVAAHPTRTGMGFDERLLTLPLAAIEVRSARLQEHEERLALRLSEQAGIPAVAGSDAHALREVGRYATAFDDVVQTMSDLQTGLKNGRFRPVEPSTMKRRAR